MKCYICDKESDNIIMVDDIGICPDCDIDLEKEAIEYKEDMEEYDIYLKKEVDECLDSIKDNDIKCIDNGYKGDC